MKPLVSVIIAFLNEERFLAEAVESVLHQTYEEWELLLFDDGSTDNSSKIAKDYRNNHPQKIRYLEHEGHVNKGVSESRNKGIAESKGNLVAFLDADDVWLPQKLDLQVAIMLAHPEVGMLGEASEYWYPNRHDAQEMNIIVQLGKERDKTFMPPKLLETLYPLCHGQAPTPSGIMVKREAAIKHGGFEVHSTGKYQLYEDQTFLVKIYFHEPVYLSSLCNHKYRQREDSCVSRTINNGDYDVVRRYFLEWMEGYMKQHNLRQKNIRRLLKRALEPYRSPYLHTMRSLLFRLTKAIERRLAL